MAVTHNPHDNSKQQVEERMEPSRRRCSDAGSCEPVHPSKTSDKGDNQHMAFGCGVVKSYMRKRKKDNQDSLSDIDDSEVVGYLNNTEEINYKRVLWEAINRNYTQAKKPRRTAEKKKGDSVKKDAKMNEKVEIQTRSSRVNYDALKLLENELVQDPETARIASLDSSCDRTNNELPNRSISQHESDEDNHGEDENDDTYDKDEEIFDGLNSGHEDYSDNEYFDF